MGTGRILHKNDFVTRVPLVYNCLGERTWGERSGMNCANCGAPMKLFREQEYFRCEYCGTYHFPGASKDGVRSLGPAPEGIGCPICSEKVMLASLDDRHRGYQCPKCQGLLLERAAFAEVMRSRRAWATQPPDAPRPLDRAHLARRMPCPLCHEMMSTHPYAGPGTIVIDTCDHCKVIWLDYGELARVVNAPGRDRGAALLRKESLESLAARLAAGEEEEKPGRRRQGEIDLMELLGDLFREGGLHQLCHHPCRQGC